MPKKRRKLNSEFEKEITKAQKNVELFLAKIYDIAEEDIQSEYLTAFKVVINSFDILNASYKSNGYLENSMDLLITYRDLLDKFINEYEI
tara:strand:- start:3721 stop:3990 length:270 start_codon:yes stop_codon:yes gene_type:complete